MKDSRLLIKIPVAVIGATGTVGRRFVSLLTNHPWFYVAAVAASRHSAGLTYGEALSKKKLKEFTAQPEVCALKVFDAEKDIEKVTALAPLVFSAVSLEKQAVRDLEALYAAAGAAVVSNNSAHRWTEDVPMILPEINPHHVRLIDLQRKNRGWSAGCIAVKPNCSVQCFMPVVHAWREFEPEKIIVSTYQAVSGAGKSLADWPEMNDNIIPLISGEEEKTEREPLRIWGKIDGKKIIPASLPLISSTCVRVPVSDGHLAAVNISFRKPAGFEQLREKLETFPDPLAEDSLPSSPPRFLTYMKEDDRPQTALDRGRGSGMGISVGRLRPDTILDWKCVALAHNTLRGAAGGAVLLAELLVRKGYIHY